MLITLDKLRFHARHGVMPQEKEVGGDFEVSLRLCLTDSAAARATESDLLEGTADYGAVYALVRDEMAKPSRLIEHVAARIAQAVLRGFDIVCAVEVEVRKCAPPVPGFCGGGAAVRLRRERRLAVLDFDGTLADSAEGIVRTMQATFAEMGFACPDEEAVRGTIGLPLVESVERLQGCDRATAEKATDVYRRIWEESGTERVALFDGVTGALQRLSEAGVRLAIATSRGHLSVETLCQRLGISKHIEAILACEDVRRAKPNPEAVLRLMDMYNVPPSQTWVVGDTAFDIAMGTGAGCHTCGVTYGNQGLGQLSAAGAERIADSFEEAAAHVMRETNNNLL